MTHADAMRRLATCRENQPDAMQVLVSADIVDTLLRTYGLPDVESFDYDEALRLLKAREAGA